MFEYCLNGFLIGIFFIDYSSMYHYIASIKISIRGNIYMKVNHMIRSETFHTDNSGFGNAMEFIKQFLADCKIENKARIKALLVVEEALDSLIDHRKSDDIHICLHSLFGTVTIEFSIKGEQFPLTENMMSAKLPKTGDKDIRKQDAIRNILLRSLTDDLKYQHKDGVNYVQVTPLYQSTWVPVKRS